jgi:hypothetical protein
LRRAAMLLIGLRGCPPSAFSYPYDDPICNFFLASYGKNVT